MSTRRSIITEAYFVPDAQIRLFSPQVYISTHPTSKQNFNSNGIDLTLKCGTVLHFPICKGNNLPFMLTQSVLDKRRELNNHRNLFVTTGKGIYTSGASIYNALIDQSITHKDNLNLDSTQRELKTWHSQRSHCSLDCCRMILARPHQKKDSESCGEFERQMVVPIHPNASTCAQFWCPACLYAKQKRKNPTSTQKTDRPELEGVFTASDTQPGDKVFCDQYMSLTKGRLMHTRG